jgi:hypothetical protein
MRENEAIVRVYPRHVSERERPMTLMLLPDLPKGVRPLVTPIVDTADAAFVMSLDCQFLAWGSRAQQLFGTRRLRPMPVQRELPDGRRRALWL